MRNACWSCSRRRLALSAMAALILAAAVLGHPGHGMEEDAQPAYIGPGFSGAAGGAPGMTFPASSIQLLSWLPLAELDPRANRANDCWGYVSVSGREYAIIGTSASTVFVDVEDPGAPVVVGAIPGPSSIWRDIKVLNHHAYAVSEGGDGIQVIDMSQIDRGVVTLVNTVLEGGTQSTDATHNVAINEASGFLYRCGGSGADGPNGLRIYDLADPANPQFVGEWHQRYVHDAQVVTYTEGIYAGREIAFCFADNTSGGGDPGLDILDVTDKSDIIVLSSTLYSNGGFSHQGWLSQDWQHVFLNDEGDEVEFETPTTTRVIDVSDLESPFEAATFTNGSSAIDHNLYVDGDLIFEANYRSGLRVYDAANPLAPSEIAFFDTYPQDDNPNFNGLWSNYPYLPSGIVIGSDIEKGLFVWWIGPPLLTFAHPDGVPALLAPGATPIQVTISAAEGFTIAPGSAVLHTSVDGGEFVEAPLVEVAAGEFSATIEDLSCGEQVRYYVIAVSSNGITWRDPASAPTITHHAAVALAQLTTLEDTMETDTGWVVGTPADDAETGVWTRVNPNGNTAQPENDHTPDPGVMCWITGQSPPGASLGDNDIDDGTTTLTSPLLDAAAGAPADGIAHLVYHRWYSNNTGDNPNEDSMLVHISNDGGATWTPLEEVTENAGTWVRASFDIADFLTPTDQMRVRFMASDLGEGSVVEAGVDDLSIEFFQCQPGLVGDLSNDSVVNAADLAILLGAWSIPAGSPGCGGAPGRPCAADLNGDGLVNAADLAILLGAWTL